MFDMSSGSMNEGGEEEREGGEEWKIGRKSERREEEREGRRMEGGIDLLVL